MLRQIILDTETTGLNPLEGHKIIEIGCIELINRKLTGNNFHIYLNPKREIEQDAIKVHGLTNEFLANKPTFRHIAQELLDYILDAEIIAHNARFDISFLDYEFALLKEELSVKPIAQYLKVTDTWEMAKKLFPGQKNSLDALCKRYSIDNKHRELHGALLDANLLANVYLAMTGGQSSFEFQEEDVAIYSSMSNSNSSLNKVDNNYKIKIITANEEEMALHNKFMEKIIGNI